MDPVSLRAKLLTAISEKYNGDVFVNTMVCLGLSAWPYMDLHVTEDQYVERFVNSIDDTLASYGVPVQNHNDTETGSMIQ